MSIWPPIFWSDLRDARIDFPKWCVNASKWCATRGMEVALSTAEASSGVHAGVLLRAFDAHLRSHRTGWHAFR